MAISKNRLYRLPDDGMISGTCAGVARYLGLDPALVRAAFVALLVFNGFGLIAYLALWYFLDPAPAGDQPDDADKASLASSPAVVVEADLVVEDDSIPSAEPTPTPPSSAKKTP
jgi:phage shock protein C